MLRSDTIGIIADDLTGANDTALQFHLQGCNTQILFDYNSFPEGKLNTHAWALSTETRNLDPDLATQIVSKATQLLVKNVNTEVFYKKIDSTLRGNIADETLAMLDVLGWDAAIIVPAFPSESRITVGGYHLLKGVPIERTEVARDPQSPICESHIPTHLSRQLESNELVALIELGTVMEGAGPILIQLNKLIQNGKKLIVIDAVSTTDLEQIVLAIEKSNYKILPCGSAGLAMALSKVWLPEMTHQHISKVIPDMPIFMVSGSATELTSMQIDKFLEEDYDVYNVELQPEQVLTAPTEDMVSRIVNNLSKGNIVIVHSSKITLNRDEAQKFADAHGIDSDRLAYLITNYLADLTKQVVSQIAVILILIGGETSYKCCNAIGSKNLQLIDEVEPAIPLCMDYNAQWIVTKSGNLGNTKTLVNILKYFEKHRQ